MIVAFEGADKSGKSTTADFFAGGEAEYNMVNTNYAQAVQRVADNPGTIEAFDRIDWLTHMVYRLAMPGYEWNDARIRTVFAAPQCHLVFMVHKTIHTDLHDELYKSERLAAANNGYRRVMSYISNLAEDSNFATFKSVSHVSVLNTPGGGYHMDLMWHRNQQHSDKVNHLGVSSPQDLMDFLIQQDAQLG